MGKTAAESDTCVGVHPKGARSGSRKVMALHPVARDETIRRP